MISKIVSRLPSLASTCSQSALGRSRPICLLTSSHSGQGSGKTKGLSMLESHPDYSGVAQHALVLDLVTMSSQILLCQPGLLTHPASQIPHKNLSNINLHARLLQPQLSRSKASLRQWQHELRLFKEAQSDQFMKQSGPYFQSGATVIRLTSGRHCQICGRQPPASVTGQEVTAKYY